MGSVRHRNDLKSEVADGVAVRQNLIMDLILHFFEVEISVKQKQKVLIRSAMLKKSLNKKKEIKIDCVLTLNSDYCF